MFWASVLVLAFVFIAASFSLVLPSNRHEPNSLDDDTIDDYNEDCFTPQLEPLTAEQIEAIHSRGYITPEEQVQEWENAHFCAPGGELGNVSWRCKKFNYCCHNCLIDYTNQLEDHDSISRILEELKKKKMKSDTN